MAFEKVASLDTDNTITLGGVNKKTGKSNPKKLEGYFLGTKGGLPNKFDPSKPTNLHVFRTPTGDVGVWGKTDLDRKMKAVEVGQLTRVTQNGTRPSNKGNDMLVFEVEVDKSNTIEVASGDSETSYDDSDADQGGYEDSEEDTLDDEQPVDEVAPARTTATRAAPPTTAKQNAVRDMLRARKS